MTKPAKTTKKKKGSVSIHLRVKPGTAEWLESQVNDDQPSAPAVARAIVEEKKRATQKPPAGG